MRQTKAQHETVDNREVMEGPGMGSDDTSSFFVRNLPVLLIVATLQIISFTLIAVAEGLYADQE